MDRLLYNVQISMAKSPIFSIRYETIPGSAEPEKDYIPQNDVLTFQPNERMKYITIPIVDDNEWEPDENFFVQISLDEPSKDAIIGEKYSTEITIINDDGNDIYYG